MPETPFIVTVDTEGDDIWSRPRAVTTHNAHFLPRFQSLCERYGYRPVYLANYEMVMSEEFVEFARDVLARRAAEIGMHLHAWNSPPLIPLTDDDFHHHPYLFEYPDEVMREKIKVMTVLLEERFGQPVMSHRAGRFGFDGRYAAMLLEAGYRIDCSVTPGVDWSATTGAPGGAGGPDLTAPVTSRTPCRASPDRQASRAPSATRFPSVPRSPLTCKRSGSPPPPIHH